MVRGVLLSIALAVCAPARAADGGVKKRRPLPNEYGRVVMDNHSTQARQAPVVFEHWLHRTMFTCRLCHVDIGFAMKAGATDVKAVDNSGGYFCGACHNGRPNATGRPVFEACGRENRQTCVRCHSAGKGVKPDRDFKPLMVGLPRGRFGNGVDWEQAELDGKIKPVDFLDGVSVARAPLQARKDLELTPKQRGMPDILFSHEKHTFWNGCEVCHPDIFVGVKKGATQYSMVEIFEGKYCGVCHGTVAFPLLDCQRCHSKPVQ
jgi:c(7)-type cytochrome triheme protein